MGLKLYLLKCFCGRVSTGVGIKADINAEVTASFAFQTSVEVKTKMEVVMKKLISGLLVGSMLLWGLVTFLQRRSGY